MPSANNPKPYEFQTPYIVHLTDAERASGEISEEHMGEAISAVHRDGLVVLENAVAVDHVDKLQGILGEEAESMAKLPTTHFNNVRFCQPL